MGVITVLHSQGVGQPIIIERRDKMAKGYYYEVIGIPGDGHRYKLGFTSNKSACLRELVGNGWLRGQIEFITREKPK